jgi:hypothetical protein
VQKQYQFTGCLRVLFRMTDKVAPINNFHDWLVQEFGSRVYKLCLDAGFTCPNRDGSKAVGGCTFCDVAGSGGAHIESTIGISAQVRDQIANSERRYRARKFIAYFQAFTNTYAPVERLHAVYDAAICDHRIVGLSVGTRADCVSHEVCELLASYRPRVRVWLELGIQTVNQATLDRVNRAETVEEFHLACSMAKAAGLDLVLHIIFGLPGDTAEDCMRSIEFANRHGVSGVKIHNLYVDSRSPIAVDWRKGLVRLPEFDEYCSLVCDALERLDPGILVHRLTGHAPSPYHLGPGWALGKPAAIEKIAAELRRRGTYQGFRFRNQSC